MGEWHSIRLLSSPCTAHAMHGCCCGRLPALLQRRTQTYAVQASASDAALGGTRSLLHVLVHQLAACIDACKAPASRRTHHDASVCETSAVAAVHAAIRCSAVWCSPTPSVCSRTRGLHDPSAVGLGVVGMAPARVSANSISSAACCKGLEALRRTTPPMRAVCTCGRSASAPWFAAFSQTKKKGSVHLGAKLGRGVGIPHLRTCVHSVPNRWAASHRTLHRTSKQQRFLFA